MPSGIGREKTRVFTEQQYAKKGKVMPYLRLVSSIILGLGLCQLTISSFFQHVISRP